MGLDSVELVLAWEAAFDVSISAAEAAELKTPSDAIRLMERKLEATSLAPCPTQHVFHRVRRCLQEAFGVERSWVEVRSPVDALLPRGRTSVHWEELRNGVGAESWPPLVRPAWLVHALRTGVIAAAFVAGWWGVRWGGLGAFSVAAATGVALGATAALFSRPFRQVIPAEARTVGPLVRTVVGRNPPFAASDGTGWTREGTELVVRAVIRDQLAIDDFDNDADFVKDLGVD